MRRDIRLRTEPTAKESLVILGRIERELAERGASVQPRGVGTLLVRIPTIWRMRPKSFRLGPLLFASKGKVTVSTGSGNPRRIRYELDFLALQITGLVAGIIVLSVGLSWRRLTLAGALLAVWLLLNLVPRFLAARSMHRLVYRSVEPIVDRRQVPRDEAAADLPPSGPAASAAADGDSSGGMTGA